MKFEIDDDDLKDMIAIYGHAYAINQVIQSFEDILGTTIERFMQTESEGKVR